MKCNNFCFIIERNPLSSEVESLPLKYIRRSLNIKIDEICCLTSNGKMMGIELPKCNYIFLQYIFYYNIT